MPCLVISIAFLAFERKKKDSIVFAVTEGKTCTTTLLYVYGVFVAFAFGRLVFKQFD